MRTSAAVPFGRKIEPAEQFVPSRFGGNMQFRSALAIGRLRATPRSRIDARVIGTERVRQRFEKGDARTDRQLGVARKDFPRQRNARGLAAARQQFLAELDQARRTLIDVPRRSRIDQRAAPVRDALQHFPEKRGVHRIGPIHLVAAELVMPSRDDKFTRIVHTARLHKV